MAWGSGSWGQGTTWRTQPAPTSAPTSGTTQQDYLQQGQQRAFDFFTGVNQVPLIQNELTADQLAAQIGFAGERYGIDASGLRNQAGFDRQRIGLGREGIGVDQASLDRQIGVNSQLQDLANQLFGFNRQGLQSEHETGQRKLLSGATARGAVSFGQGYAKDKADIYEKLLLDVQRHDVDRKKSDVTFGENKAQLEDRKRQLDLRAKGLGIDSAELESRLKTGLQRLGIDRDVTMEQLFDAMNSNDLQRRAIADQIYQQAIEGFNTNPGMFNPGGALNPGFTGGLGGSIGTPGKPGLVSGGW